MKTNCDHVQRRRAMRTAALLIGAAVLTPPVAAQGVGVTTPAARTAPPAPSAEAIARRDAQATLASALTRIAANPNDWRALFDAGQSALVLNDAGSATGFLGRAEQLAPTNGDIKAALGAAMVQMENPRGALEMFAAARANGASERLFLSDQALAHDLLGEQAAAQKLYERALVAAPSPETERRYALSLGISGQVDRAVTVLSAQLRAQDRAAWRVRSFVLSFNGRHKEASDILYATTPKNVADSISGFLGKMDRLTPAQQALAAHFGRFPQGALPPPRVAVAAATPAPAQARAPLGETTIERRARLREERRQGRTASTAPTKPVTVAMATPTPTPAPAPVVATPAPPPTATVMPVPNPSPSAPAAPSPGFSTPDARLTGVGVSIGVARELATPTNSPATTVPPTMPTLTPTLTPTIKPAPVPTPTPAPTPSVDALPASAGATPAVVAANPVANPVSTPPTVIAAAEIPASSVPATPLPPVTAPGAVQGPPGDSGQMPQAIAGTSPAIVPAATTPPVATPAPEVAAPTGFSLADIARSIEIPTEEAARSTGALDAAALEAVRVERLKVAEAAAARREKAAAAAKAKADAEAKARADAEAKVKAAEKAEADRKKANPARLFVQIATGANPGALAGDYRRIAAKNAAGFKGQSGWTAEWGRTRRLLVGPFKDQKAAQAWLAAHKKAGGDGFPWSSDAGEVVTRIGGK